MTDKQSIPTTKKRLQALFESQSLAVVSTAFDRTSLHTSTMLFATDAKSNICIATHTDSLKAKHLRKNPHVSGVMWEIGNMYVQWEGVATELHSRKSISGWLDKLAVKAAKLENFWPPIFQFRGQEYALFVIKPTWLRVMDLSKFTINSMNPHTETLVGKSYEQKSPRR